MNTRYEWKNCGRKIVRSQMRATSWLALQMETWFLFNLKPVSLSESVENYSTSISQLSLIKFIAFELKGVSATLFSLLSCHRFYHQRRRSKMKDDGMSEWVEHFVDLFNQDKSYISIVDCWLVCNPICGACCNIERIWRRPRLAHCSTFN